MTYNDVYRQCVKFHKVWRSNVQDDRKVCLETCLCALVCFVKFYVFVLDEIDVYEYIRVENVRTKLPKDQPHGP